MTQTTSLEGGSKDIIWEKFEVLRELFPEAFPDGKLDPAKLGSLFDPDMLAGKERYWLTWPGKTESIRSIRNPSYATLKPRKDESVDWDTTENLFIEGDNLEVLKLLQKSYYGKVKMIYIDPPYNTGNDFVYPDNFSDTLGQYLRVTGQIGEDGARLWTNTEQAGRYHSNWLNMIWPRLYLARNLLREDGSVFISIDDHEASNLRIILDEIFWSENFVWVFVWKTRQAGGKQIATNNVSIEHEYVVCYAKNMPHFKANWISRNRDSYSNPDNDPRWDWAKHPLDIGSTKDERPNCFYDVVDPETGIIYPANPNRVWAFAPESMRNLISERKIIFHPEGKTRPYLKKFWTDLQSEFKPVSTWIDRDNATVGYNSEWTKIVNSLFDDIKVFDYPKPVSLIKFLLSQAAISDWICLDFFAGSGTTAHAVMALNAEDGWNRKFICVQLPELTDPDSEAGKAGFRTIADISKERIRRAAAKLNEVDQNALGQDRGFRAFRLDVSNFRPWKNLTWSINLEHLAQQLELHIEHIDSYASQDDLLFEVLIKAGFPPTEKAVVVDLAGLPVYSVGEWALLICLAPAVNQDLIRAVADAEPVQFICLDSAFKGNDQLKANAIELFRSGAQGKGRELRIEFRTI